MNKQFKPTKINLRSTPDFYRYRLGGDIYGLNKGDLKSLYKKFVAMNDKEFMTDLPKILHFASYVSWINGDGQDALADNGIVHCLIHILNFGKGAGDSFLDEEGEQKKFKKIRQLFKKQ